MRERFLWQEKSKSMKEFDLLKFATMLKDSENLGTRDITIANDPRILPLERY